MLVEAVSSYMALLMKNASEAVFSEYTYIFPLFQKLDFHSLSLANSPFPSSLSDALSSSIHGHFWFCLLP